MVTLRRKLWRRLRHWRFLLFQRHRHDRLVVETVAGKPLVVLPGVLNPKLFRSGEFLAAVATDPSGFAKPEGSTTVLDMGTGSGVGAVFAAAWAGRVIAVDINPAAVRCAHINALLNGVEDRVEVRQGDLFEPVAGLRFDVVLFNPPYLAGQPENDLQRALWSTDVAARFAAGLAAHLNPGGSCLLLLSDDGDEAGWLGAVRAKGFDAAVLARRDLISETLTVYRVWARSSKERSS